MAIYTKSLIKYLPQRNPEYLAKYFAKDTANKANQNGLIRKPAIMSYKTTLKPVNTNQ